MGRSLKIIDLSFNLEDGMDVYPGSLPVKIARFIKFEDRGFNDTYLDMGAHIGTHLDAPFHFIPNGKGVDEVDLSKCYGEALLLLIKKGKGETVTVADLRPFKESIELARRIVVKTGWFEKWGTKEYFEDFPTLNDEAASWLLERGLVLLGTDTPSAVSEKGHEALLGSEVVIVEALNLANLDSPRFIISVLPLKVTGSDGSPIRAVAIVET